MNFIDIAAQQSRIRDRIEENIRKVLDHGRYINGPEVRELEEKLAQYVGVKHAVGCSSGTDALLMPLMAYDIGPGDAVFTTTFTFIATAEVIQLLRATPVFCDIEPKSYNIDADKIISNENEINQLKEEIFSSIEPVSIDYGIMEKADNKTVIPADFGWTDLGNWTSIDEILVPDKNNNRCSDENLIVVSSSNCTVFTEGKTIAIVGIDNIVIAESGDNILVMNKNCNQEVRKVVEIIKNRN